MAAEAYSSARVLPLIRQAQVVDELLHGAKSVKAEVTERLATFIRNGATPLGLLMRSAC